MPSIIKKSPIYDGFVNIIITVEHNNILLLMDLCDDGHIITVIFCCRQYILLILNIAATICDELSSRCAYVVQLK